MVQPACAKATSRVDETLRRFVPDHKGRAFTPVFGFSFVPDHKGRAFTPVFGFSFVPDHKGRAFTPVFGFSR